MGEVEVRKERKGVEDKSLGFTEERLEGAEKGEGVSRAPSCLLAASFPTWSPALHTHTPTHTHTHTPLSGEVGSPLSPFFSFQEGSGFRCCGWDIPWLRTLFPDLS